MPHLSTFNVRLQRHKKMTLLSFSSSSSSAAAEPSFMVYFQVGLTGSRNYSVENRLAANRGANTSLLQVQETQDYSARLTFEPYSPAQCIRVRFSWLLVGNLLFLSPHSPKPPAFSLGQNSLFGGQIACSPILHFTGSIFELISWAQTMVYNRKKQSRGLRGLQDPQT